MINVPFLELEAFLDSVTLVAPGISENRFWTYYYPFHSTIWGTRISCCRTAPERLTVSLTACACPYSAEPPVRILFPRDEVTLVAVSLECVVLMCELSREDALVRWYKDGLEVEESEALVLESDGPRRRLVLPAAQPQDGGEFVCDAGDDSAFFTVTVTGGQSPRPPWGGREAGG